MGGLDIGKLGRLLRAGIAELRPERAEGASQAKICRECPGVGRVPSAQNQRGQWAQHTLARVVGEWQLSRRWGMGLKR